MNLSTTKDYSQLKEKPIKTNEKSFKKIESTRKVSKPKQINQIKKKEILITPPYINIYTQIPNQIYEIPITIHNISSSSKNLQVKLNERSEIYDISMNKESISTINISPGLSKTIYFIFKCVENKEYTNSVFVKGESVFEEVKFFSSNKSNEILYEPIVNIGTISKKITKKTCFFIENISFSSVDIEIIRENSLSSEIFDISISPDSILSIYPLEYKSNLNKNPKKRLISKSNDVENEIFHNKIVVELEVSIKQDVELDENKEINEKLLIINRNNDTHIGTIEVIGCYVNNQYTLVFDNEKGGGNLINLDFGNKYYGEKTLLKGYLYNNSCHDIEFSIEYFQNKHLKDIDFENTEFNSTPFQAGVEMTERIVFTNITKGRVGSYNKTEIVFNCHIRKKEKRKGFHNYIENEKNEMIYKSNHDFTDGKKMISTILIKIKYSEDLSSHINIINPYDSTNKPTNSPISLYDNKIIHAIPIYTSCEVFKPCLFIDQQSINFYECSIGEVKYGKLKIFNKNKRLSIDFSFSKALGFDFLPKEGRIEPNAFVMIVVSFHPSSLGNHEEDVDLKYVNGCYCIKVSLFGECLYKKVDLIKKGNVDKMRNSFSIDCKRRKVLCGDVINNQVSILGSIGNISNAISQVNQISTNTIHNNNDNERQSLFQKSKKSLPRIIQSSQTNQSNHYKTQSQHPKISLPQCKDKLWVLKPIGKWEVSSKEIDYDLNVPLIKNDNEPIEINKDTQEITNNDSLYIYKDLDGNSLKRISISSNEIDFGNIYKQSKASKSFWIKNNLLNPILVEFFIDEYDFKDSYPKSLVLKSGMTSGINLILKSVDVKKVNTYMKYVINKKYVFKVVLIGNIIPAVLKFESFLIKFDFRKEVFSDKTDRNVKNDSSIYDVSTVGSMITDHEGISFVTSQSIRVYNEGNVSVKAETKYYSKYFSINPKSFIINSNSFISLNITFNPVSCPINSDIESHCEFHIENGNPFNLKLYAYVPKSQVKVSTLIINFGDVHIGISKEEYIFLYNEQKNSTVFSFSYKDLEDVLTFSETVGIVYNKKKYIKLDFLSFSPQKYEEKIYLNVRGDDPIFITIIANVIIPDVRILENEFNFGKASFGEKVELPLTIINKSQIKAFVIIDIRSEMYRHFEIEPRHGKFDAYHNLIDLDSEVYSQVSTKMFNFKEKNGKMRKEKEKSKLKSKQNKISHNFNSKSQVNLSQNSKLNSNMDLLYILPRNIMVIIDPESIFEFTFRFNPSADIQTEEIKIKTNIFIKNTEKLIQKPEKDSSTSQILSQKLSKIIFAEKIEAKINLLPEKIDFQNVFVKTKGNKKDSTKEINLKIYNLDLEDIDWKLEFNSSISNLSALGLSFSHTSGTVKSISGYFSSVSIKFTPKNRSHIEEIMYIYIKTSLSSSFYKAKSVIITGEGVFPQILFNKREVVFPSVPVGIESKSVLKIRNHGYDALQLVSSIVCEYGSLPLKTTYLNGNILDEITSEISIEFSFISNFPLGFTAKVRFNDYDNIIDEIIYIYGVCDRSYLSNILFINKNLNNIKFIIDHNKSFLNVKINDLQAGLKELSYEDEEYKEILYIQSRTLQEILKYILPNKTKGNTLVTNQNFSFPDDFSDLKENFQLLIELIRCLSGSNDVLSYINTLTTLTNNEDSLKAKDKDKEKNKEKPVSSLVNQSKNMTPTSTKQRKNNSMLMFLQSHEDKKEKSEEIIDNSYRFISNILIYLQSQGALLNNIIPEYLFDYDQYSILIRKDAFKHVKSIYNHENYIKKTYLSVHLEGWISLIHQIFKIYLVNKVNLLNFQCSFKNLPEKAQLEDCISLFISHNKKNNMIISRDTKQPSQNTINFYQSNIYSNEDLFLLKWMNILYGYVFEMKDFYNILTFHDQSQTGKVVFSLVKGYLNDFNKQTYIKQRKISSFLNIFKSKDEASQSQIQILKEKDDYYTEFAFNLIKEFGIFTFFNKETLTKPSSSIENYMFYYLLFQFLPSFSIKDTIIFSCILNDEVTKSISIYNNNPYRLEYIVKKDESDDFVVRFKNVSNPSSISIDPMENVQLNVTFKSRISDVVETKLYLLNRSEYYINYASPLIYILKSNVLSRRSIGRRTVFQVNLYSKKEVEIEVFNPFSEGGEFKISIEVYKKKYILEKPRSTSHQTEKNSTNHMLSPIQIQSFLLSQHENKPLIMNSVQEKVLSNMKNQVFLLLDSNDYINEKETIKIESNSKKKVRFLVFPNEFCLFEVNVILKDYFIGELQFTFEVQVLLPLSSEVIEFEGLIEENSEFSFNLPLKNKDFHRNSENYEENFENFEKIQRQSTYIYSIESLISNFTFLKKYFALDSQLTQSIPIVFKFYSKNCSLIIGDIVITNLNNINDIRVYTIKVKVKPKKIIQKIEFECPLYEEIIQNIPFLNHTDKKQSFTSQIFDTNTGVNSHSNEKQESEPVFSCLSSFEINPKSEENLKINFKPLSFIVKDSILIVNNLLTEEIFEYILKGKVTSPLAEKTIHMEVQANVEHKQSIRLINTSTETIIYKVSFEDEILGIIKGKDYVKIGSNSRIDYEITVNSVIGRKYYGRIVFRNENRPEYFIWFIVNIDSKSNLIPTVISKSTVVRSKVYISIPIENKSSLVEEYKVHYEGQFLYGNNSILVKSNEKTDFKILFFPLKTGDFQGKVHIFNENQGENIYFLSLTSAPSPKLSCDVIRTALGSSKDIFFPLENPIDEVIEVVSKKYKENLIDFNEKEESFEVVPEKFQIEPLSVYNVKITYTPSVFDQIESVNLKFLSNKVDNWDILLTGIAEKPSNPTEIIVNAYIGGMTSGMISFKNPYTKEMSISIWLDQGCYKEEVFKLLNQKTIKHMRLSSKSRIDVLFTFTPVELMKYYCKIVIFDKNNHITWTYNVIGITEVRSLSKFDLKIKSKAKIEVKSKVFFDLKAIFSNQKKAFQKLINNYEDDKKNHEKNEEKSKEKIEFKLKVTNSKEINSNIGIFGLESQYKLQSMIDKCLHLEIESVDSSNKDYDRLYFNVKFLPLKPFFIESELIISKKSTGQWVFNVKIEASLPDFDNKIIVKSSLNQLSQVSFRLENAFTKDEFFKAYFTFDSSSEFDVAPKEGVLVQIGKEKTEFIVSYYPKEYGKIKKGRLVVETENMIWIFLVVGKNFELKTDVLSSFQKEKKEREGRKRKDKGR